VTDVTGGGCWEDGGLMQGGGDTRGVRVISPENIFKGPKEKTDA
jgi:hypothetical protein